MRKLSMLTALVIAISMLLAGCQGNASFKELAEMTVAVDTDGDGLPDDMEQALGTDPAQTDTDNDGLSDYYEAKKYLTNPLSSDSDQDGTSDSDWAERREYTYTIQAIVDLRPPFSVQDMNDFYQDARVVEELEDDVVRVEVILYPEAELVLNPGEYAAADSPYTTPTYTKNYSPAMQEDVLALTGQAETDVQAVIAVLQKFGKFKLVSEMEDLGYQSALPLHFSIYRQPDGTVVERRIGETTKLSLDEIKARVLFADSMYQLKVHSSCSSSASLRGGMLRAAGLEERTVFAIPLIYYYDNDGTQILLKEEYNLGYPDVEGRLIADHFYHEVNLGGQWVRVDYDIDTGVRVFGKKPYIKILACHDQVDYDFTTYWNFDTWLDQRPFKYVSVIEQEAKVGTGR